MSKIKRRLPFGYPLDQQTGLPDKTASFLQRVFTGGYRGWSKAPARPADVGSDVRPRTATPLNRPSFDASPAAVDAAAGLGLAQASAVRHGQNADADGSAALVLALAAEEALLDARALGRRFVTMPAEDLAIHESLAAFKARLDERLQESTALHQRMPAALIEARATCARLHDRACRTLEAHRYLGVRASWLIPPALDLRCLNRKDVQALRLDLVAFEARLKSGIETCPAAIDPAALQAAATSCREILDEASVIAEEHDRYHRDSPELERVGDGAVDLMNRGLLGMEAELSNGKSRHFKSKGSLIAGVAKGRMEAERKRTGTTDIFMSGFESVSDPLKNPRHMHLFTRSSMNYFIELARRENTRNESTGDLIDWPDPISRASCLRAGNYETGLELHCQLTTGIYLVEHLPLVLDIVEREQFKVHLKDDGQRLNEMSKSRLGRDLSRKSIGFLLYLANSIRRCNRVLDTTAHAYLRVMPRKSFSSMFRHSLKSEGNRFDVRSFLEPDERTGLPLLMEMLEIPASQPLFGGGVRTSEMLQVGGSKALAAIHRKAGPTTEDFLLSIFDPERFGHPVDLMSALAGGWENGRTAGISSLGDVDETTGEAIVEIRGSSKLPRIVPVTALPGIGILNYLEWSKFNPNIPRIVVPDRTEGDYEKSVDLLEAACNMHRNLRSIALGGGHDLLIEERDGKSIDALIDIIGECAAVDGMKAELKMMCELAGTYGAYPTSFQAGIRARHLAQNLYEAFPRLMEMLFRPEFKAWKSCIEDNPPSPGAADEDFADMLRARPLPTIPLMDRYEARESSAASASSTDSEPKATLFAAAPPSLTPAPPTPPRSLLPSESRSSIPGPMREGAERASENRLKDIAVEEAAVILRRYPDMNRSTFMTFFKAICPDPLNRGRGIPLMSRACLIPMQGRPVFVAHPHLVEIMSRMDHDEFKARMLEFDSLIKRISHPAISEKDQRWIASVMHACSAAGSARLGAGDVDADPVVGRLLDKFIAAPRMEWPAIADCLIALNHPGSNSANTLALVDWIFSLEPADREKLQIAERTSALVVDDVASFAMRAALGDIAAGYRVAAWNELLARATSMAAFELPWLTLPLELLIEGPLATVDSTEFIARQHAGPGATMAVQ